MDAMIPTVNYTQAAVASTVVVNQAKSVLSKNLKILGDTIWTPLKANGIKFVMFKNGGLVSLLWRFCHPHKLLFLSKNNL